MNNKGIRVKMFVNEIKQWEVAQELNVSEPYLTKILRKELTDDKRQRVENAIDAIITRRAK